MPIYEYSCIKCGSRVETLLLVKDSEPIECGSCSGSLRRVISPCAAHFKGPGFHVNDYVKTGNDKNGCMPAYKGKAN